MVYYLIRPLVRNTCTHAYGPAPGLGWSAEFAAKTDEMLLVGIVVLLLAQASAEPVVKGVFEVLAPVSTLPASVLP